MPPVKPVSKERILRVADGLPGAPKVLTELQDLLKDPNSDLGTVTSLLRRDSVLTARIIRIANGAVYNRGEPVGALEDALARVGFAEVFRLTSLAAMMQLGDAALRYYPGSPRQRRERALLTALLMELLATDANLDPGTAYTTGLLSSAGRVVLDVTAQRDLRIYVAPPLNEEDLIDWELNLFGITSHEAGAHVLRSWRFPADVFVAIRDHLLHDLAVDPLPNAKLLHVALAACDGAGFPLAGFRHYGDLYSGQARAELGLTDESVAAAVRQALFRFERMKSVLA
jgi:HD-like signal output (HDOD) protein